MKTILSIVAALAFGAAQSFAQVPPLRAATPAEVTAGTSRNTAVTPYSLAQAGITGGGGGGEVSNATASVGLSLNTTNATPYDLVVYHRYIAGGTGPILAAVTNADGTLFYNYVFFQSTPSNATNTQQFFVPAGGSWLFTSNSAGLANFASLGQKLVYYSTNGATVYATSAGSATTATTATGATNLVNPRLIITSAYGLTSDTVYSTLTNDAPTVFGTDQQAALQVLLDKATNGPIKLLIDGIYTTGGLRVRTNTIIETLNGCGLVLATSNNVPLLRNYTITSNAPIDQNISIIGGIFNCNGYKQAHDVGASNGYAGGWVVGFEFIGVNRMTMRDVRIMNFSTFPFYGNNLYNFQADHCEIDAGPSAPINRDGWHFNGPAGNITINDSLIRSGDDCFGINANEPINLPMVNYTPYYNSGGPITNVTIRNATLRSGSFGMFRILSSGSNISGILIDGIHGQVQLRVGTIDNFLESPSSMVPVGSANIGDVKIINVDCQVTGPFTDEHFGYLDVRNAYVTNLTLANWSRQNANTNTGNSLIGQNVAYVYLEGGAVMGNLTFQDWKTVAPNTNAGWSQIFVSQNINNLRFIDNDMSGAVTNTIRTPVYLNSGYITNFYARDNSFDNYTNFFLFSDAINIINDRRPDPVMAQMWKVSAGTTITTTYTNYDSTYTVGDIIANKALGVVTNRFSGRYTVRAMVNSGAGKQARITTNSVNTTVKAFGDTGFGTSYAEFVSWFPANTEIKLVIDSAGSVNDYQLTVEKIK